MTTHTKAERTPEYHTTSGAIRLVLTLCGLTALLFTLLTMVAVPAQADGASAANQPPAQATYLADHLRENPVYVTDQLPREIPRSMAPDFAQLAERTGVPTYLLVLPSQSGFDEDLLGAVHERLGRDGLYVLLDESGVREAAAYGVSSPTEAARRTADYELPFDAGPLRNFERFVDVVVQDQQKAEARAEAASEKLRDGYEPEAMYIGPSDRQNQSFVTGVALTGIPLTIVMLVPCLRWAQRRSPRAKPTRPATTRPKLRRLLALTLALATADAITLTAPLVFDQTKRSAAPLPSPRDMTARVERVAEGLARDPIYVDPESPQVLDATQLSRLRDRIGRFGRSEGGGPVYVTVVPHLSEDESAGDAELFASAARAELGKTDGVYVVADPLTGYVDAFNHGLRLESLRLLFDLPESITAGDDRAAKADDHLLGERLDALMTYLDKSPRTEEPTTSGHPLRAPSPKAENSLPPLFATDFWPGLFVGAVAAVLLVGLLAGILGGRGRGAAPAQSGTAADTGVAPGVADGAVGGLFAPYGACGTPGDGPSLHCGSRREPGRRPRLEPFRRHHAPRRR
ncbi:hypothetical protein AB0C39_19700 [Streptomyces parvulus]|uniref:hypothetical protein n=1 Tax=Streptomyces parvulus TaxID=146923 RepID=UPI00340F6930